MRLSSKLKMQIWRDLEPKLKEESSLKAHILRDLENKLRKRLNLKYRNHSQRSSKNKNDHIRDVENKMKEFRKRLKNGTLSQICSKNSKVHDCTKENLCVKKQRHINQQNMMLSRLTITYRDITRRSNLKQKRMRELKRKVDELEFECKVRRMFSLPFLCIKKCHFNLRSIPTFITHKDPLFYR